ncbi:hypothetical protein MNBD_BACTEROID05-1213 [hydrothermal vent metagenome]|uniref:CN hydrolase domain-containing protein n=1 Tax=hydrothermal vent metagenome TaxID=652676 RepID=A0A3B0TQ63_9ZZZZ
MKTAVIQVNAGRDKKKNIEKAVVFIKKAIQAKARFIVLPEVFNGRFSLREAFQNAEDIPGESLCPLMGLAKENKVFILAGSIYEKATGSKKCFNTSVLIDSKGKIIKKYRKINLFQANVGGVSVREKDVFLPGKRKARSFVEKFCVGLSICYDLRFPLMFQNISQKRFDILCVPSAFTQETGKAHWEVLLRARAIENFCYVLAPNQVGKDSRGICSYGNSMIVDPWGKVLARASNNREEIIYADVSSKVLKNIRGLFFGKKK